MNGADERAAPGRRRRSRWTTALIHMSGVSKVYKSGTVELEALRNLDLAVDQGELMAIIGPSGSANPPS